MRSTLSIVLLVCLLSAMYMEQADGHLAPLLKGKGLGKGVTGKDAGGTALAAVISSRKLGLGLKAILFKPLLLVALAKIKLALLLGKPLALLAIKKLLLKAVLGKLLLKIPLILLKGKALLVKMLALKFALVTKGLLGLKAPLAMLFLGACALGSGLGLAVALGATLHKLKEHETHEEEYSSYEDQGYALPPPRPVYGPPAYSAPVSYPAAPSYSAAPAYSPAPAYSSPVATYAQASGASQGVYGLDTISQSAGLGGSNFGTSGFSNFGSSGAGLGGGYAGGRRKRDTQSSINSEDDNGDDSEEDSENSEEETIDESPEDIQIEFEAARTNGNAYLYMAAQFDEQSCGRRLMCEVYQKPHDSLSEDEILLQEIFGYPLSQLNEEDEGTPKEMYYRAAQLGASYQGRANNKVCARFYPTCPHNAEQLIHIFVTEDVQTNEIDTDNRPAAHLQPPQTSARLPFFQPRQPVQTPIQTHKPIVKPGQQQVSAVKPVQQQQIRRPVVVAPPNASPQQRQRFVAAPAA